MLKLIIALVVLLASGAILFFRFVGLPPGIEAGPHVGIGETLAEQAVKSLGNGGGRIVLIAPDSAAFRYPGFEIQLKTFYSALRKARVTVASTNLIKLDPLYLVRVPAGEFANLLRNRSESDVIVSLLGPPVLTAEQKSKVPAKHARVVALCAGDTARVVNLKALFDEELLHAAIVDRPAPATAQPQTSDARTWFNYFYQLITPANTADLPAVTRPANP